MVNWKRNLAFVWLSQFTSIAGFMFAMPFVPYYMQELGVNDPVKLKIWVAVFAAAAPLSLAVFSPIWGLLADRYGRRLMLLRANLGAAVFLGMMGAVNSVGALVAIRALQGMLTGTMTAAQTLVMAHTPQQRSGFALGTLSSGVYSGAMAGAFAGGFFSDAFGFRNAFFVAAGLLILSTGFVVFGTDEAFERPEPPSHGRRKRVHAGLSKLTPVLPLLALLAAVAFFRHFDSAFLPLLVQDIHGTVEGAATRMGGLFAVACIAGFISGILVGHLADRVRPAAIGTVATVLAGMLMIPHGLVKSMLPLFLLRFGVAFCLGGLTPVFHSLLAKTTAARDRGFMFGWAATVRSLGWGAGPLVSGLVAYAFGLRAVFVVGGVLFLLLALIIRRLKWLNQLNE